jgi:pimeloyl-ACP methyl ester carboxylesterase
VTRRRFLGALLALSALASAGTIWAAVLPGGPRNDVLRGTSGADKLYGKGGNDRLFGGAGNDLLIGGPGRDVLAGGRGADRLVCGLGRDTANADRRDRVAKDCESVTGITKPPPPPPPLPGQRIDVGGYSLYIECAGSGSPTVILEAGAGAPSATLDRAEIGIPGLAEGWRTVRAALASETRVCAYDRAGLGASDRRPLALAPTAATFADELRTLLANANVPGPYILYGGSFGGLLISGYTLRYASDVVGLVFSDALGPASAGLKGVAEGWDAGADLGGFLDLQFGSRPLVVLTSTFSAEGADQIRRSSNSLWLDAPGTGHIIPAEAPQLTVEAVRLVLAAAQTTTKLPPCEQTRLPTLVPRGRCQSLGS